MKQEQAQIVTKLAVKGHPDKSLELLGIFGLGPFRIIDPEKSDVEELIHKKLVRLPPQRDRIRSLPKFSKELKVLQPFLVGESRKVHKPILFVKDHKELIEELKKVPLWKFMGKNSKITTFVSKKMLEDTEVKHDDLVLIANIYHKNNALELFLAHQSEANLPFTKHYDHFDHYDQDFYPEGTVFNWEVRVYDLTNSLSVDVFVNSDNATAPKPEKPKHPLEIDEWVSYTLTPVKMLEFVTKDLKRLARNIFNNQAEENQSFDEWLRDNFSAVIMADRHTVDLMHPLEYEKWKAHFRPNNKHGFVMDFEVP